MNENPYASPAELTEKPRSGEEEKYVRDLRWLAWGVFWILCSCVLMMPLFSIIILVNIGMMFPPREEGVFMLFFGAAVYGVPATQLTGLILCCFCPDRLVKRAWLYVIGSVATLLALIMIGFIINNTFKTETQPRLMMNFAMVGMTASVVVWQVFLLRVARGLRSTAGVRLAWSVMAVSCVSAAGVIAYINLDFYGDYHDSPEMHRFIQDLLEKLGVIAAPAYGGIYAALLETLRKRIWQGVEESL